MYSRAKSVKGYAAFASQAPSSANARMPSRATRCLDRAAACWAASPPCGPATPPNFAKRGRALRAEAAHSFPRGLRQPSRSHNSRAKPARENPPRCNTHRSHRTVSGLSMRRPIRTLPSYTDPALCVNCVRSLGPRGMISGGCASLGVEVGFERHSKEWPACRPNENILPTPLTRVAGGWHDVLELAMWGS